MRDDMIWKMARAAHDAHYCVHMGDHTACDNCRGDGKCFELSGGFERDENWEWWHSAKAALAALEEQLGITVGVGK